MPSKHRACRRPWRRRGSSRSSASVDIVLPLPLSPATPKISPGSTAKLDAVDDRDRPGRARQARRAGPRPRAGPSCASGSLHDDARVEDVAQAVAEEVEREHDGEDRQAGERAHPPVLEVARSPSATIAPHSAVGGCAPSPRNERPESSSIALPMSRVASTSDRARRRSAARRARARAATTRRAAGRRRRTRSRRSSSTRPRTTRAYAGQETITSASTALCRLGPSDGRHDHRQDDRREREDEVGQRA